MNTKLLTRIGIAAVVVLAAGAFWWSTRTPKETALPSNSPSESAIASSSATPLPIVYAPAPSNWQVYASASMGMKVSFPKDWQRGPCGPNCIIFGRDLKTGQPIVGINATKTSLASILEQAAPYQLSKEEVKVSGITWTKIVLKEPQSGAIFISHFAVHGGMVFEVGLAAENGSDATVYGQMLSSFTFTK